jgi:MinD-like ATPase involved in chromosome partitioning or flagellar assembly
VAQVIAVNAVHAGSGVSTITANLAALLATGQPRLRVGVVDACLTAPTLHLLFGVRQSAFRFTINDFLLGRCKLAEAIHPVALNNDEAGAPALLLVPGDPDLIAVAKAGRQAYDVENLGAACQQMAHDLGLDVLLIDCDAGLPRSTLVSLAAASAVLLVLALDKQQYQGVARTVAVVDQLAVARRSLAVNLVSPSLRYDNVYAQVAQSYGWDVSAIIPFSDELLALGSASLFVLGYPAHPVTGILRNLASGQIQGLEIPG